KCPASGVVTADSAVAHITAASSRLRETVQHRRAVGEDKGGEDVKWALLTHSSQGRQRDELRLPLQHFDDRRALDALLLDDTGEGRRLENAQPNIEADPDHNDAEPE